MMKTTAIIEKNQNFWQLGCILGSGLGMPAMLIGANLANLYGEGSAIIAICVANIVLWMFALCIISMSERKNNAVENVKVYLGKITGTISAWILLFAFLTWYAIQIRGVSVVISNVFEEKNELCVGSILGLIVALLSIGGIRLIKKFCLVALPLLVILVFYFTIKSKAFFLLKPVWTFSFPAILPITLNFFAGVVNTPTFFRHAHSKADAVLGLSLMTVFHIFFQIFPILAGIHTLESINPATLGNNVFYFFIFFVLVSFVCINLINIYFSSASLEVLFPSKKSNMKYLLIGIVGTLFYIVIKNYATMFHLHFPVQSLEVVIGSFIISLGIVLVLGFLFKIIVRDRLEPSQKIWNSFCWLIGCVAAFIFEKQLHINPIDPLIAAIISSSLSFLCIFFVKETIWAIKSLSF